MSEGSERHWLTRAEYSVIFGVLAVCAVVVIAGALKIDSAENQDAFWLELSTIGLQAIVVGIAGALVTAALRRSDTRRERIRDGHEKDRDIRLERARIRNAALQDFQRRLRTAYGNTKRVRRELEGVDVPTHSRHAETAAVYRTTMGVVNDQQLELEALRDEVEALLGDHPATGAIKDHLDTMEKYLNDLFNEFTRNQRQQHYGGAPESEDYTRLGKFISRQPFRDCFANPYRKVRKVILQVIHHREPDSF